MLTISHIELAANFLSMENCFLKLFLDKNLDLYISNLWAKYLWQGIFEKVLRANKYICVGNSLIRLKQKLSLPHIIIGK